MNGALAKPACQGGVVVRRALTTDDDKFRIGTRKAVTKMEKRCVVIRQELVSPSAARINHCVEARKVFLGKVHEPLLDNLGSNGGVLILHEHRHVIAPFDGLFDDRAPRRAVGCDHSDFLAH